MSIENFTTPWLAEYGIDDPGVLGDWVAGMQQRSLAADLQALLHLAPSRPAVSGLVINLLSMAFMRNEQREALLLTCNAEQRYLWMLEHQAELVERIPQYHIAAYLGVDAVSLSRIKRKLRAESDS